MKIALVFNVKNLKRKELAGNCIRALPNHKPLVPCCQSASSSEMHVLHQVVQCDDVAVSQIPVFAGGGQ